MDAGFLTLERGLEDDVLFKTRESVDRLAADDVGSEGRLKRLALGLDDLVDTVGLPELIWLDVQAILIDARVLAKFQPVLV